MKRDFLHKKINIIDATGHTLPSCYSVYSTPMNTIAHFFQNLSYIEKKTNW